MNVYSFSLLFLLTAISANAEKSTFSLLNEKDLKRGLVVRSIDEFKKSRKSSNSLWICGENPKKSLRARCDESGNEDLTIYEEPKGVLELTVAIKGVSFDYDFRHARPLRECREMARLLRKVRQGNLSYCVLGNHHLVSESSTESLKISPMFYQLKSPLGYVIDIE